LIKTDKERKNTCSSSPLVPSSAPQENYNTLPLTDNSKVPLCFPKIAVLIRRSEHAATPVKKVPSSGVDEGGRRGRLRLTSISRKEKKHVAAARRRGVRTRRFCPLCPARIYRPLHSAQTPAPLLQGPRHGCRKLDDASVHHRQPSRGPGARRARAPGLQRAHVRRIEATAAAGAAGAGDRGAGGEENVGISSTRFSSL